jgi:hypothetical protein
MALQLIYNCLLVSQSQPGMKLFSFLIQQAANGIFFEKIEINTYACNSQNGLQRPAEPEKPEKPTDELCKNRTAASEVFTGNDGNSKSLLAGAEFFTNSFVNSGKLVLVVYPDFYYFIM